jgi:hypothetical protein
MLLIFPEKCSSGQKVVGSFSGGVSWAKQLLLRLLPSRPSSTLSLEREGPAHLKAVPPSHVLLSHSTFDFCSRGLQVIRRIQGHAPSWPRLLDELWVLGWKISALVSCFQFLHLWSCVHWVPGHKVPPILAQAICLCQVRGPYTVAQPPPGLPLAHWGSFVFLGR